jgi:hypothetical protein
MAGTVGQLAHFFVPRQYTEHATWQGTRSLKR